MDGQTPVSGFASADGFYPIPVHPGMQAPIEREPTSCRWPGKGWVPSGGTAYGANAIKLEWWMRPTAKKNRAMSAWLD